MSVPPVPPVKIGFPSYNENSNNNENKGRIRKPLTANKILEKKLPEKLKQSTVSAPPAPPKYPNSLYNNNTNREKMPLPVPPLVLLKKPKPDSLYLPKKPENNNNWNNEDNNETQKRLNQIKKNFSTRKNLISFNTVNNCSFDSLIRDMLRYKTTNYSGHKGNVYAHSIWTAISVYNLLYTKQVVKGRIFVNIMNLSNFDNDKKDLTILCGFLHDIGKIGDNNISFALKNNHPEDSFKCLIGDKKFLSVKGIYGEKYKIENIIEDKKNGVVINIRQYLQDSCKLLTNNRNYGILAISSGMHYSIGNASRSNVNFTNEDYIKKLFEYKKIVEDKLNVKYKEDDMQDILHMCIIVSIADVIGNVEIDYKETDEKFIFHDIKKVEDDTHKEPKSAYNKFNYNTGNIPSIVEYLVKSGISAYKNKKKPHSSLTMKK